MFSTHDSYLVHRNLTQTANNTLSPSIATASPLSHEYNGLNIDAIPVSASGRTIRILISIQPTSSTTKLCRISITGHGTIVRTGRDHRCGLDAFTFSITAAVTSANLHVSLMIPVQ